MFILCLVLFLIFALREVLFWTNLWQLKEYRLDRLFIHLRDTRQGRRIIFSHEIFILLLGLILYLLLIVSDSIAQLYPVIVFLLFFIFFIKTVREVIQRKIKRPVLTVKAAGIVLVSLCILLTAILFPLTDRFLWFVILGILTPYVVSLTVFLFAFPTEIYTDIYIQKAKEKRKTLKKLIVIAVSGSYGKSSTKEAVAHILSQKFSVVKTNLSNNTPLAIAKTMLSKITRQTDIFVVELGAYKKGEIAALADIVKPTLSITTAISDQHLALYGTMEDIFLSEMELIQRLPRDAEVLLNADSLGVRKFSERIKHKKIFWYATDKKNIKRADTFFAQGLEPAENGAHWNFSYKKNTFSIQSPLLGIHTVSNILPAVFLALQYGMTESEIKKGIASLKSMPKTMMKIKSKIPGTVMVDDSFNASPESVQAAIQYLHLFKKRKILVLSPLIELGNMGKQRHYEIGKLLSDIDLVLLTNKNFYSEIESGIRSNNGKTKIVTGSYEFLARVLKQTLHKRDVVVFEGKEAGIVLSQL